MFYRKFKKKIKKFLNNTTQTDQINATCFDKENIINSLTERVISILPDIDQNYVHKLINTKLNLTKLKKNKNLEKEKEKDKNNLLQSSKINTKKENDLFKKLMDIILSKRSYPKKNKNKKKNRRNDQERKKKKKKQKKKKNWYTAHGYINKRYKKQAFKTLKNDFNQYPSSVIRKIFKVNKYYYSPTYLQLSKVEATFESFTPRQIKKINKHHLSSRMKREIYFIKKENRKMKMKKEEEEEEVNGSGQDRKKLDQNDNIGESVCSCCYVSYNVDQIVRCKAGHLICVNCLNGTVKYAIGMRKNEIKCPTAETNCVETFSNRVLVNNVPKKVLNLFERLVQESEISLAGIKHLKKCPFCNYAVIIRNPNKRTLECMNPKCLKDSCLRCGNEAHKGKSCEQVKKQKNIGLRTYMEEELTKALLRTCNKCGQKYFKNEGCNKIDCSHCGEIMCYICGESINKETYDHFSNEGSICKLWTTKKEDQERVRNAKINAKKKVRKIMRKRAMQEREKRSKKQQEYIFEKN
ncbi:e3 ubiquitin-protein ligase [Anaeramoeba flamelloides]|uniref:E3 ubiquitin-protein ligase n=1 Tax=Anaeramoeba flamelloides TaxID=1746091 RepID=A0AAV7YK52_9EUKA|nr:e3 ubiquitin-protein ligase [Anaeramoeba flamelloides]